MFGQPYCTGELDVTKASRGFEALVGPADVKYGAVLYRRSVRRD